MARIAGSQKTIYGQYSFAIDGGAQSTIGLGVWLPVNSVIRGMIAIVRTAPVGAGASLSFGITGSTQALLVTTGVAAFLGNTSVPGVDFDLNPLNVLAFSEVTITISGAALTAGRIIAAVTFDELPV